MYNLIFGSNPLGPTLLAMLKLDGVGRYRDAFVSDGMIAVYTRNGGGNRECWSVYDDSNYVEGEGCGCVGCFMEYQVMKHPNYLSDQDDEFDSTYATIYYSFPEEWKEFLEQLDSGEPFEPDKRWLDALDALKEGTL
jgi:hypothetical protein